MMIECKINNCKNITFSLTFFVSIILHLSELFRLNIYRPVYSNQRWLNKRRRTTPVLSQLQWIFLRPLFRFACLFLSFSFFMRIMLRKHLLHPHPFNPVILWRGIRVTYCCAVHTYHLPKINMRGRLYNLNYRKTSDRLSA